MPAAPRTPGRRSRRLTTAAALVAVLGLSACTGTTPQAVTVTSRVTVPPTGSTGSTGASRTGSGTPTTATRAATTASTSFGTTSAGGPAGLPRYGTPAGQVVKVEPDGFTVTRLPAGAKPPQFVVVSFDGVGWHEKWQYWKNIQTQVPFHFTGFLSGTYLLSSAIKDHYQGPGRKPGQSDISWNEPADLPVEIADLNDALARGDEIGTHFNGHFCSTDQSPGGQYWDEDDWNTELDQFFSLLGNVDANNGITDHLDVQAAEVKGERTPCLEGRTSALYPALRTHGITYDSSIITHTGISWPLTDDATGIWDIGMSIYPIHGTLSDASEVAPEKRTNHLQITMDYNFWISQRNGATGSPAQSAADSQQVLDTYTDMYTATFTGNRAPLILGNHFEAWNNNAYSDALSTFVRQTCGKPDTYCVPFRDLVDWLTAQDPAVVLDLQRLPAEAGS
jgi:hypothetical protein